MRGPNETVINDTVCVLSLRAGCAGGENASEFRSGDMGLMRLPNGTVINGTVLNRPGFSNRPHYLYTVVYPKSAQELASIPTNRFSHSNIVASVRDAGVTQAGDRTIRGYILGTGVFSQDQFIYFEEVNGRPVAGMAMNTTNSSEKNSYNEAISTFVPPKP